MRNFLNAVFLIITIMFLITFSMKNDQEVSLSYYFVESLPAVPLSILLLLCFFSGVIVGALMDVTQRWGLRREIKRLKKSHQELENELKTSAPVEQEE